jgi:FKBP-type peptidyl-prolyl cis-trans isomerase
MRSAVLALMLLTVPAAALAQAPTNPPAAPGAEVAKPAAEPEKAAVKPVTGAGDDENTLYALGALISGNLKAMNLSPAEVETVKRGLTDSLTGKKLQADPAKYEQKIQSLASARIASTANANKESGKAYAAKIASEKGVQKTPSGVLYQSLQEGTGAKPKATDTVKVNLEGKLTDGTVFDDSAKKTPTSLVMNQLFPCFSEGIAKMKVGGKARLVCPSSTAFGDQGRPPTVPPGSTLVFEVQLLEAKATPNPQMPTGHGSGGMPPGHGGGGMPPGHGGGGMPPGHP